MQWEKVMITVATGKHKISKNELNKDVAEFKWK